MTSPLSGDTLAAQRAMGRWKKYFLAVSHPNTVFTARINQTFETLDGVKEITYDGGTGTFGDVKPGMSCWIGSSAGAFDIGIVRVRKPLTSTVAFIGRVSGLALADNYYLTFVDDFQIWGREPQVTNQTILIDSDIVFGSTSSFAPIVKAGPPALVLEMTGSSVSHSPNLTIYSPTGQTAAAYLTTAPGASATSGLTTATPMITYDTPGEYYESYTVTDTAGISSTAYRKVFVNPSGVEIAKPEITGNIDSGGWSCRIEGYAGVDVESLHDGMLCVLWRQDYVGTARDASYGPYPDAENIRLFGWIIPKSLTINPQFGTASFTIEGPAFWLDRIGGAPMIVTDVPEIASNWSECVGLTTDKALYRLVHWQSTLSAITDIIFTGDETPIPFANVNSGSLRQQINGLANEKLLAHLFFDAQGCGKVFIPQSLQDSAGKAALTVLWDVSSSDWIGQVNVPPEAVKSASMMELGSIAWDGTTEIQMFSRAPGNIPGNYGSPQAPYSGLAVNDQDAINRLTGDKLAMENSQYPAVDLELYWANDFIDFATPYIVRISLAAADTPRGITWTNKRVVPIAISFKYDPETGAEGTLITFAEETTGVAGVFYFPPQPSMIDEWSQPGFGVPANSFPPLVPFANTWFPDVIPEPPPAGECGEDALPNAFSLSFDLPEITGIDEVLSAYAYFPCKIRAGTADNPTFLKLSIEYGGDALGAVNVYAIDSAKNRLLTGAVTPPGGGGNWYNTTHVAFSPVGETDVAGFEIELEAGGGLGSGEIREAVNSGTVLGTDQPGADVEAGLVTGQWYAVQSSGGPWSPGPGFPNTFYDFRLGALASIGSAEGVYHIDDVPSYWMAERTSALYGRIYFQAMGSPLYYDVNDSAHGDNSGSLGYTVYNAIVKGDRIIYLSTSGIYNVCAAG